MEVKIIPSLLAFTSIHRTVLFQGAVVVDYDDDFICAQFEFGLRVFLLMSV